MQPILWMLLSTVYWCNDQVVNAATIQRELPLMRRRDSSILPDSDLRPAFVNRSEEVEIGANNAKSVQKFGSGYEQSVLTAHGFGVPMKFDKAVEIAGTQSLHSELFEPNVGRFMVDGVLNEDACDKLEHMFVRHRPTVCEACPISNHGKVVDFEEGAFDRYTDDQDLLVFIAARRLMEEHTSRFFADADLQIESTKLLRRTGHSSNIGKGTHADNCRYNVSNHECAIEGSPFRTHSAVLFLKNLGVGGDFYWGETEDELLQVKAYNSSAILEPQKLVKTKCGRLVGFTAGLENLHGVTPLRSGRRYVIEMSFVRR